MRQCVTVQVSHSVVAANDSNVSVNGQEEEGPLPGMPLQGLQMGVSLQIYCLELKIPIYIL